MTFDEFEKDWLRRHRGSLVPKPRVSSWGLISGLVLWAVIATGAALVSGAHSVPAILVTIPAVVPLAARQALSLFGFTIFELLIFAGSLYRRTNRYAALGLLAAMIGALAANVGSSIQAVNANSGDTLALIVAVVLALIAPLAAFLAGEMVHHLYAQHQAAIAGALADYDQKRRELDATINREWVKLSKRLSEQTDKVDRQTLSVLDKPADRQPDAQPDKPAGFGYNRTSDGQARVIAYLSQHQDEAGLPLRELAGRIGVNKDTVNAGRKAWQGQTNGNGYHSESSERNESED